MSSFLSDAGSCSQPSIFHQPNDAIEIYYLPYASTTRIENCSLLVSVTIPNSQINILQSQGLTFFDGPNSSLPFLQNFVGQQTSLSSTNSFKATLQLQTQGVLTNNTEQNNTNYFYGSPNQLFRGEFYSTSTLTRVWLQYQTSKTDTCLKKIHSNLIQFLAMANVLFKDNLQAIPEVLCKCSRQQIWLQS